MKLQTLHGLIITGMDGPFFLITTDKHELVALHLVGGCVTKQILSPNQISTELTEH